MTEDQLRALPAFQGLPVYAESDPRADTITSGAGRPVRECATLREVEECLKDPGLAPLGALRVNAGGRAAVVAYFARS